VGIPFAAVAVLIRWRTRYIEFWFRDGVAADGGYLERLLQPARLDLLRYAVVKLRPPSLPLIACIRWKV